MGIGMTGPLLQPEYQFCLPAGVTPNQTIRTVVHTMEQHPEILEGRFDIIAIVAMQTAWPCKK